MNKTKHIPIRCKGSRSLSYRVLKPFQGNLKEMSKVSADKLKASILKYGWRFPIFVWKNGKSEWIHDGHGRLLVLKSMISDGYTIDNLPVADIEAKNKREAGELLLALNSRYQSITDEGLYEFMNTMEIDPIDLDMFDLPDIDLDEFREGYFEDTPPDEGEDDAPEVPKKPKSKLGDLYQLGGHRVLCGDATKVEDVERLMDGEKADMVFTDPPYGIAVVKNNMVGADFGVAKKGGYKPVIGDETTETAIKSFQLCADLNIESLVFWGGNYYASDLPPSKCWFIWDKREDTGIENTFADCEIAWTNLSGASRIHRQLWNGMIRKGESEKRVHPTQKPLALAEWCFDKCKSTTILDPFLGSGTTLIASEKTSRICYGMELDPHYIDVIVQRWVDYTGQTGILKNGKKIKWQTS